MDPLTHQSPAPLRRRTTSTAEFNQLPTHVYPEGTTRGEDGRVRIGGVDLCQLAEAEGTPAYVMSEDDFRGRCRRLAAAFGGGERVHYASKAFLSAALCRWVAEEGLALDVASENELRIALSAGFPAERITVHGNNKSRSFLELAVRAGVEFVVVDSFGEIESLDAVVSELRAAPDGAEAPEGVVQNVLVRVTPGVHVETHEFIATSHEDQKFGFSLATGAAEAAAKQCLAAPTLRLRGLHCHVGSQVFEADGFVLAAERLLGLWRTLLESEEMAGGHAHAPAEAMDTLDLGGGYGIAYMADEEALDVEHVAGDLLARVAAHSQAMGIAPPKVNVEPGRAVAGPSMVTVYRVGTIKDVHVSDKLTRRYISVDGGMSDNIRPALYDAEYDVRVVNRELSGELLPSRIVGSHCESGDVLISDVLVPSDLVPGDLIMLGATGAYCYAMSSRYNMMTRPPVVVVRDGEFRTMLRRETVEDLLALEVWQG